MRGKPYLQRIGLNNLAKGIFDAVFDDDSVAWSVELKKYWGGDEGLIIKNKKHNYCTRCDNDCSFCALC